MLQQFVDIRADVRIFCAEGRVLCGMWRIPAQKDGLGNLFQGARAETRSDIPSGLASVCVKIAKHLDASYLCIDFLYDGQTFYFSEIETGGGFASLDDVHRLRVAQMFFGSMS